MRVTTVSVTLALVVAPVAICEQVATAPESASTRSRAFLDAWLHHIPGAETGKITPVDDEAMRRILPDDGFFTVRFTRYPRAQLAPPPLKLENLIAVKRDGTVEQIENLLALQRMLTLELPAIRDESEARAAVLACVRLAEEFFQDGQYVFRFPEDAVSVVRKGDQLIASGKSVVTSGGTGTITATLTVDASGKIVAIAPAGRVRPDARLR